MGLGPNCENVCVDASTVGAAVASRLLIDEQHVAVAMCSLDLPGRHRKHDGEGILFQR